MRKYWPIFLVLVLSYWAVRPLLHPGFFPIHDDTQVVRVQQMAEALRDGQFPVRWVKDLGYGFGYPIFNFYAPLAYYIGAFFTLIGFDVLVATKLMMGAGVLLAGVFMYFLAREFWGEVGGVVAALFYLYGPYHALDIYVRGAVGEFWAIAFLPLVFYGLVRRSMIISAFGYAAVILSHNLTAMMLAPFILLVGLLTFVFSKNKKSFVICHLKFVILALGISAFYWLPALFEMGLTKVFGQIGGGADWRDHFVYFDQLWASPWGFGGSAPGRLDGISFMIGKLHLIFVLLALATGFFLHKKAIFFSFLCFLFSVFLTNKFSLLIWEAMPLMAFIQYPWRFLIFATFAASFMAGSVAKIPPPRWANALLGRWDVLGGAVLILGLLFFNTKYFQPQMYLSVSSADYINEENIKWKTSKISDEYLPKDFSIPSNKNEAAWEKVTLLAGEAKVETIVNQSQSLKFNVQAQSPSEILINLAYFPGWKVWVDGKESDFTIDNGKIKLFLPPGNHQVFLRFTNTAIRTAANLISLVSWVGLVGFVLKYGYGRD